ncbi:MAG: tRNA (adenosine(37)-N6)-threonylcarbamoyltransferase complex dimerization subunit type 1 TsaB [Novosphingobium sp.]
MRTLVIDSATEACSVALFDDTTLIGGDWRLLGRGHAEALVPMVAALPGKGRADRIAVSLGPGSFTGLRVGLAAARALALAWQADLVGYPTLALVAAQALHGRDDGEVAVCTTGGHGEWFVASYAADGSPVQPLASLAPEQAAARMASALVAGSQAEALVRLRGSGEALTIMPDARHFDLLRSDALMPETALIYGRAPDARLPGAPR